MNVTDVGKTRCAVHNQTEENGLHLRDKRKVAWRIPLQPVQHLQGYHKSETRQVQFSYDRTDS